MSIYIDQKIEDRQSARNKTLLIWHSSLPNVAVSSYDENKGAVVSIYHDDGSLLTSDITRFDSFPPPVSCMQWHSSKRIIYVGYENGNVIVWNDNLKENDFNDFGSQKHQHAICVIKCSDNGTFLVSGDAKGTFIGWRVDSKGFLSLLFFHDHKEAITDSVFRTVSKRNHDELGRLAQAAVSGDEKALNLFSDWNPESQEMSKIDFYLNESDTHNIFVGYADGNVCYMSETGHIETVLRMDSSIHSLLYYHKRDILIIVTESLIVAHYEIGEDGSLTESSKIKLSGRKSEINVHWAGSDIMSISTGERLIYLWNVNTGYNHTLALDDCTNVDFTDYLTCTSFDSSKNILSAGTNNGHVISWKQSCKLTESTEDETWQIEQVIKLPSTIKSMDWNTNVDILGAITVTDVYFIKERSLCFAFKDHISAVQLSARQITLESLQAESTVHLLTDTAVRGVYLSGNYVALSSDKQLTFYEINFPARQTHHIGTFSTESSLIGLNEQTAYIVNGLSIELRTFQGTLKQTLSFMENEGQPIALDVVSSYLVSCTTMSIIKIWDISRREAKLHFGPKSLEFICENKQISSIKCNQKANKLSFTMGLKTKSEFLPDCILYVLDIDTDTVLQFDFGRGKSISEDTDVDAPLNQTASETEKAISGHYPFQHFWISEDDRLVTCEAKPLPPPVKRNLTSEAENFRHSRKLSLSKQKSVIVSCYVIPEQGILIQDHFFLNINQNLLLGIKVPFYYILKRIKPLAGVSVETTSNSHSKPETIDHYESPIDKRVMRDFVGMEDCDKVTKEALLLFSYYLTAGNLDEAFRAIRVIKSQSVWCNMAQMCVKTKRLDVAKVCLGKMRHIRAAMALQNSDYDDDVKVGILAVHLDMFEDAEKVFIECNRYDLLNRMFQDSNQWNKAIAIAEKHDRIHLRNTYYNYAKHLEFKKDINGAMQMYEKADVHTFEVPRMLFEKPRALEAYVLKAKNKKIYCWWAQYLESIEEIDSALHYYELAEDYLSLVRLYCYINNISKAAEIANETGDRAACFHIGRQFEMQDNIKEAIHFFTRARAFTNAIRICKEHELEDQLMNLALMSSPEEMVDVAAYYEKQTNQNDKAIMLYHKSGMITKAIELAFKSNEQNALFSLANDLPENTGPELLFRCAQFFLEMEKYDKAVDFLALAMEQEEALKLCLQHKIHINEELAEKLTPDKKENPALRLQILERIGDCCAEQENYHLAAKKYTQAGKKTKAMKALLKSGDTQKIIFFATVSRLKENYIMAANYLQTLNWRQDMNIMNNIVSFYKKARSAQHLCSFYEACAQDEIDEYQNYEKAKEAINEAYKCLMSMMEDASEVSSKEMMEHLSILENKMELIKQYILAQAESEAGSDDTIKQCRDLLSKTTNDSIVRRGDIYALMVEYYCNVQNYKAAYDIISEMKAVLPGTSLACFLRRYCLEVISKELAVAIDVLDPASKDDIQQIDDETNIIEDVVK